MLILILYNLLIIPYFYKKILKCYITIRLDYIPETDQTVTSTDEIIENILSYYDGINSLYSGQFFDKNNVKKEYKYYRIASKDNKKCSEMYANFDRDLTKKTPNVNLITTKDIKSIARVSIFYIVNNLIIIIFFIGLYILLFGKISLKLKISKTKF